MFSNNAEKISTRFLAPSKLCFEYTGQRSLSAYCILDTWGVLIFPHEVAHLSKLSIAAPFFSEIIIHEKIDYYMLTLENN